MPTAQVPQFINLESKIVGPLTLRQFLFIGGGGVLIFILYYILQTWLWIMVSMVIGVLSIVMAFVKINEQPIHKVLINALKFYISPRLYTWRRSPKTQQIFEEKKPIVTEKKPSQKRLTVEELEKLAQELEKKEK